MTLSNRIKTSPRLKALAQGLITPKLNPKPRLWVKFLINPFFHKKGKGSVIRHNTRIDVFPWKRFEMGKYCTLEDFCTINNGVGDIILGDHVRIGMGNTIIGPVLIGNDVILAQNVVLSGLNHGYIDINKPIRVQPVSMKQITLEDEVWIGANSVIVAGVSIGRHSVIAAGSVVTKDIPSYSIAAGNPAKVIKKFNAQSQAWEKISN
jgi:acetyltransferase-like isoleucine patch superfamily enzyme